jgi:hypothetical protein
VRYETNLKILRRRDPTIVRIFEPVPHVTVYTATTAPNPSGSVTTARARGFCSNGKSHRQPVWVEAVRPIQSSYPACLSPVLLPVHHDSPVNNASAVYDNETPLVRFLFHYV